jgi:tRNA pseudouridine55 synthase
LNAISAGIENNDMWADGPPHGWLVIDKPSGISSNRVVGVIRRLAGTKAGHAGTLDLLATGVLPIALGQATKTTAYAMNGLKCYRFRIRWGVARDTDDREGEIVAESASRPSQAAIEEILPRFTGPILQSPPPYSAIRVDGRRAYMLARASAPPALTARTVQISALRLIAVPDRDHADCEALVGKGTYIRALARDLGAALGTFGHIAELRRLSVGPFTLEQAISLDSAINRRHSLQASGYLLPIETALDGIPALALTAAEAARVRCGQRVTPYDSVVRTSLERLEDGTVVSVWYDRAVIALAKVENGGLRPARVINY